MFCCSCSYRCILIFLSLCYVLGLILSGLNEIHGQSLDQNETISTPEHHPRIEIAVPIDASGVENIKSLHLILDYYSLTNQKYFTEEEVIEELGIQFCNNPNLHTYLFDTYRVTYIDTQGCFAYCTPYITNILKSFQFDFFLQADTVNDVIADNQKSEKRLKIHNYFRRFTSRVPEEWKNQSKSQLAQDLFVLEFFQYQRNGLYVDIGANDGVVYSNTYLLETRFDWIGMLVEPAVKHLPSLISERPNSLVLPYCVYNITGFLPFIDLDHDFYDITSDNQRLMKNTTYRVDPDLFSGLVETNIDGKYYVDEDTRIQLEEQQGIKVRVESVPCYHVQEVFSKYLSWRSQEVLNISTSDITTGIKSKKPTKLAEIGLFHQQLQQQKQENEEAVPSNYPIYIDYLSIDAEGADLSIIEAIDWTSVRIAVIHIEVPRYSQRARAVNFLTKTLDYIPLQLGHDMAFYLEDAISPQLLTKILSE